MGLEGPSHSSGLANAKPVLTLGFGGVLEVEHGQEAAIAEEHACDHPELEDLWVSEFAAEFCKKLIICVLVVNGHLLCESDGQLLAVGKVGVLEVGQGGHHLLGHSLLHRRHSATELSSGAFIELGNLEAHEFLQAGVQQSLELQRAVERPKGLIGFRQVARSLKYTWIQLVG